jgi:hypothetical protein
LNGRAQAFVVYRADESTCQSNRQLLKSHHLDAMAAFSGQGQTLMAHG